MATHHTTTPDPISIMISLGIFIAEFLGAIIAITSDGFIRWASLGMVGAGLFINYVVNRKKFNDGIREWWRETFKKK